ncbi:helix-turn-helix domain-containing protein [Streptomyces spectabilis]|uniref:Transcriptional regulator with XRE-family HTH domain n=1 Tax=Streptomyces spectabilis TaxID=68270 RepID=A0A5P2X486_STRST|nr:helix-turn-helix transcriptional regulator [Streptomyces spectabilis]MBB5103306.1 transcriptional regulator with XRE-family HTH domain [Streptomyces spectabilis]MCI3902496.1 helix-turn-helix domain-containing protein [Streptomyces spectabilis]QEV59833.1 XRE family transcriptional regulator [Streptomyces spectabilis]GGV13514.1 transcriptional regulator [Streptomyces spectabilis]
MNATIGDRIRHLREFRDITQEELASHAHVSVDTIRKLEQNRRQSARIDTLRALARALDVELERLLGQPTVTQQLSSDDGGLLALRDAIQDVGALPGVLVEQDVEDPPAPDAWMEEVKAATSLYWEGNYAELSSVTPLLLRDGRAVAREAQGSIAERVWRQLGLAYQLAASLATQSGHPDWAFAAVEKQLAAAQKASDPLLEGMGVSTLSWVLLRQGRWEHAQSVAEQKADALEPRSMRRARPAELAVHGNLLLAAATPAARRDRRSEARNLLNLAEVSATRSGPVRAYGSAFSVMDVKTQQVNIALAGRNSEPDEALTLAGSVDLAAIERPVHAASHRLDVAHARYQTGDADGALVDLLDIEEDQPQWIRYQTLAAATVREMLEAERRRNTELRGLAARLGVDPTL